MPLVNIHQISDHNQWGLWLIEETEEFLAFEAMESAPEEIVSPQKRLEYLTGRVLIRKLAERAGLDYQGTHKDEWGKPLLKGLVHHISLSHSFPHVAAQIHATHAIGIDVEQPKYKLLRIASRVLSKEECVDAGTDPVKHCVYWCAKEALYKLHGRRGLHFNNQLNVAPFQLSERGFLNGVVTEDETSLEVPLGYEIYDGFVVVYTASA